MEHIDITFDLETCSLAANAAVIQVAAVAWNRAELNSEKMLLSEVAPFEAKVDLRSCVMDGFDFDPSTLRWWANKPAELRSLLASGDCYPIREVFAEFIRWMEDAKTLTGAKGITLWAQGSDMDIAILRHVVHFYGLALPLSYQDFRDARTFIIEIGSKQALVKNGTPIAHSLRDHKLVYASLPPMPENFCNGEVHNALYDALRTSWNLHHCFRILSHM